MVFKDPFQLKAIWDSDSDSMVPVPHLLLKQSTQMVFLYGWVWWLPGMW